jgi:hypothetical protein
MLRKISKEVREVKRLKRFLKKLDPRLLALTKSLNPEDEILALRYLLISKLKEWYLDVEKLFFKHRDDFDQSESHVHYLEHKLSKVSHKIKLFELSMTEEEFKKIYSFIYQIQKEVENV